MDTPLYPRSLGESHARIARLWDELTRAYTALQQSKQVIAYLEGEVNRRQTEVDLLRQLVRAPAPPPVPSRYVPHLLEMGDVKAAPAHESRVHHENAAILGGGGGAAAAAALSYDHGHEAEAHSHTRERQRQWQAVTEAAMAIGAPASADPAE